MREPVIGEVPGVRRLVLGYDGGCTACGDLAERISAKVGDRLEIRSLHHPQVEHWREQALGKDAPWAPTLFEVGGASEVRAWRGPRMAVRLARTLERVSEAMSFRNPRGQQSARFGLAAYALSLSAFLLLAES